MTPNDANPLPSPKARSASGWRDRWVPPILYLALAIAFLAEGLPSDRAPVATDPLYANVGDVPFRDVRPRDFELSNPFLSDQALVFYPWLKFMSERVRGGELPLWSPLSGGGLPFMGNLSSALFFPTTWLCFLPPDLLPVARGMYFGAILRLFLAGWFGWLLMRRLGLSRGASATGGGVSMLFGYQVVWLFYSLSNVACVMPLCLYVAVRFCEAPRLRWGSMLAVAMGLQFLGGHAETSVAVAIAVTSLVAIWGGSLGRVKLSTLALRYTAVGLGAIVLASVQILPFAEYLFLSHGRVERLQQVTPVVDRIAPLGVAGIALGVGATLLAGVAALLLRRDRNDGVGVLRGAVAGVVMAGALIAWSKLGMNLRPLLWLDPDLYGNPLRPEGYRGFEAYTDVNGGFVGMTALLLSMGSIFVGSRRRLVWSALIPLLLAFALFGGVEPFHALLKSIPPFDLAADTRMLPLVGVGVALLAALAIDELGGADASRYGRFYVRFGVAALVAIALLFGFGAVRDADDVGRAGDPSIDLVGVDANGVRIDAPVERARLVPEIDRRGRGAMKIAVKGSVPEQADSVVVRLGGAPIGRFGVGGDGGFDGVASAQRAPAGVYRLQVVAEKLGSPIAESRAIEISLLRDANITPTGWIRLGVGVFALSLLIGLRRKWWVGIIAPTVVLFELASFGLGYNVFVPIDSVYPRTRLTDFLVSEAKRWEREGRGPFRVLAEDLILQPNMNYAYDLQMVRAYDQLELASFNRLLMEWTAGQSLAALNATTVDLTSPLARLFNLAYVVSTTNLDHVSGFERVHESDGGIVYRNDHALPRAFLVEKVVDSRKHSRLELFAMGPTTTAYLEEAPPDGLSSAASGSVVVEEYRLNRVRMTTHASAPTMVILSDNDYPGWRATVNGRAERIFRSHGTFRGVQVPAGEASVEFVYRPASVWMGVWGAFALLGIVGLYAIYRRFRGADDGGMG